MKPIPKIVTFLLAHFFADQRLSGEDIEADFAKHEAETREVLVEVHNDGLTAQYLVKDDAPLVYRKRTWCSPFENHPIQEISVQALPDENGSGTYAVVLSDGEQTVVATMNFDFFDEKDHDGRVVSLSVTKDPKGYIMEMAAAREEALRDQIQAFRAAFPKQIYELKV